MHTNLLMTSQPSGQISSGILIWIAACICGNLACRRTQGKMQTPIYLVGVRLLFTYSCSATVKKYLEPRGIVIFILPFQGLIREITNEFQSWAKQKKNTNSFLFIYVYGPIHRNASTLWNGVHASQLAWNHSLRFGVWPLTLHMTACSICDNIGVVSLPSP